MNKYLIVLSVGFIVIIFIATALIVSESSKSNVAEDLVAACPKTYENDLLTFTCPCSWLLTSNDNESIIFTEFYQGGNTFKRYFFIKDAAEGFTRCENGEYYSERMMTVPSLDGQELEACYHEEHGGQTLTIRSDRSETGYISISSDGGGVESVVIPSLIVK